MSKQGETHGQAKPRTADVARWVAILATAIPAYYGGAAYREMQRERDNARGKLASWGLDEKGQARS